MKTTTLILLLSSAALLLAMLGTSSAFVVRMSPLFRYWSPGQTDHFYTTNWKEINQVIPPRRGNHGYTAEGIACVILTRRNFGAVPLYRYYKRGDHFYTTNPREIGTTTPGRLGKHGYKSEGKSGYCFPNTNYWYYYLGAVPLYRYWNPKNVDHFYTTNAKEIGTTTPGKRGKHGYISEGIACYVFQNDPRVR